MGTEKHRPPPTADGSVRCRFHEEASNSYPTTFVQADTSTFKHVVQMLTGSTSDTAPPPPRAGGGSCFFVPPIKKKQSFKLYERRNSTLKNGLFIDAPPGKSPGILSPSILDFPALALSPEEKAIAEKKFYLHPSPRGGAASPRLLPLFPVTSPPPTGIK
ncbi:VQ motif-containing protein 4-like [Andrographis paniculata]|uniref:VQ motif-containing protein 4-like n=1 Tax=Andrographis paniculata TaxID=175694 RepID=UPI0021E83774|nr:VQ motif-containing protein 4-like [Andrographis paniculata]